MDFIKQRQRWNTKKVFVLLVAVAAGMFAFTPRAAHAMECNGSYPGTVTRGEDYTVVQIQEVETSALSSYSSVKPYTGGNRVCIYFDTDIKSRGAEYCLFVYRDTWTFRKASQPGFFSIEVDTGSTANSEANSTKGFTVEFKSSHIQEAINRCWNYHMGQ